MPARKTPSKPEIAVAHWPNHRAPNDRLGCGTDYGPASGSDAFWITLRLVREGDDSFFMSSAADDIRHLGLWVWLMPYDGGIKVNVDLRVHDMHSGDLAQIERIVKLMRSLTKKMGSTGMLTFQNEADFEVYMAVLFNAMGIVRAVQYGRGDDRFAPLSDAVRDIAAEFARRVRRLAPNKTQQTA